jgi:nitroimidazol reductase NimA-like FMN-containing flavoprotein (pyridoxamine 5'-phosphate oxidase superfamily)
MDGDFGDTVKAWPNKTLPGAAQPGMASLTGNASLGAAWPKATRNKLRRYPDRGSYEQPDIYRILDAALLCHVAYVIDGQPYCMPTSFWRDGDRLYWHGSSASRMLRTQAKAIPACLTVCHLDGIVLSRSAFHHSVNYRSVMAFGKAEIIDGEAKDAALRAFVNRFFPGRWDAIKQPSPQEVKGTTIISMRIEEASAKTRSGPPSDDEADYALPIWAGVIPVQTLVGEALDCPRQHPDAKRGPDLALYQRGRRIDEVFAKAREEADAQEAERAEMAAKPSPGVRRPPQGRMR